MKKKNRIILFITIALALVALLLVFNNRFSTLKQELKDFAIEDTASVNKIFLADKAGKQITLDKISPGNWVVNSNTPARKEAVDLLLYTMMKLEVKNPVAKAGTDNVLKNIAATGVKVEIYQNSKLVKTYYVGGATQDQLGTFMLIEHSATPFVMWLPGHNGYLTSRYFTDEASWKSRVIFRYSPLDIKNVTIEYPLDPENSFMLNLDGKGGYTLNARIVKIIPPLSPPDTGFIYNYLSGFNNVQFEILVAEIAKEKKDSILTSIPICMLTVKDFTNKDRKVVFYRLGVNERSLNHVDEKGNPLVFDPDRMYAQIDGKDFVIVQHFVFDKILRTYFDLINTKKGL